MTMKRKVSGASACDVERSFLTESTDTEGAIYRVNRRGKLHDMRPGLALYGEFAVDLNRSSYYPIVPEKYGPIAHLEDHPRLDLRSLAAHGFLREGELTELKLVWDRPKLDLFVSIGLRPGEEPFVILAFVSEAKTTRQIIALTPRPGPGRHRYRFIIPGYGCAEVLACRFHRFAPARLQRLVHSSQRKPQLDPAAKLEAALLKRAAARSKPA